MSLKTKTLTIIGIAFFSLTIGVLAGSWFFLYKNLEKTEIQLTRQDVMRGLIILQNELSILATVTGDYAGWDDTYAFVRDGNKTYIESNLVESTFDKQRLNVLLIMNNAGKLVYGEGFDLKTSRKTPISQSIRDYFQPGSPLIKHAHPESVLTGLIALPEGPLMFSSRPILNSDYQGPIRGTMIMGRFLDAVESDRLAELARLTLRYQAVKPLAFPKHKDQTVPFSISDIHVDVQPLSADRTQGSTMLSDIFGRPILKMVVQQPRILFQQGVNTLEFLVLCGILIALALGCTMFVLLEKLVLSRVRIMSDEVKHIGLSGNNLKRVSVTGQDELSGLADTINRMIETIEASREAIREESDRYRAVVEDQTEFICRFGLQGNLIFANEALGRYLEQTPDGLLGRSFFDIFPWENIAEIKAELLATVTGQPVRMFDAKMIFPNNKELNSRWTIRAIVSEDGQIREYQAVGHDITGYVQAEKDKKAVEEQFFQSQKMEAIGTLAGGIAHDFNNILMGIGGYVSLMLYDTDLDHPHYRKLKAIEEQIKNASSLTRDLLGFARGGAYEVKPANLNQILETTSSIFGRSRKDIEIRQRFEQDLWTAEVDRGQMEQVFMNLFVNAAQAMPAGGNLFLETKNVTISDGQGEYMQMAPGPYVQVSITDEGVGMDEETKERIFEPFFTTREREKRGSGLGLASVYGIVKNHGGMINVYTEKGVGTTFRIYLPAVSSSTIQGSASDWDNQHLLKGTEGVLVVEDEDLMMDVTVKMLGVLGYKTFSARSGDEALEAYRGNREQIDLVLLDMIMPGMSGEETFQKLKEIHPEIKVILASGYSLNEQATRIMGNGCRAFLQKPYNTGELSRTLRNVLDQLF
ncbi:MAG: response regulator [Syntrophaceae bacterium]|nr:response regulator [Syntrophaceae bacterium]